MNNQGWTEDKAYDWDNIGDEPPAQLDPGIYHAQVTKAEAEATSNNNPAVQLELKITAGFGDESIEGRSTRLRYESLVLTKDAAFRLKQFAKAAGCGLPKSSGFAVLEAWAAEITGADVIVRLRHRASKDKTRMFATVDRYLTEEQAREAQAAGAQPADAAAPKRKRRS